MDRQFTKQDVGHLQTHEKILQLRVRKMQTKTNPEIPLLTLGDWAK